MVTGKGWENVLKLNILYDCFVCWRGGLGWGWGGGGGVAVIHCFSPDLFSLDITGTHTHKKQQHQNGESVENNGLMSDPFHLIAAKENYHDVADSLRLAVYLQNSV